MARGIVRESGAGLRNRRETGEKLSKNNVDVAVQRGAVAMLHGVAWPGRSSASLFVPLNMSTIEPLGLNLAT